MNTIRFIIGVLGTLFFGYATISLWNELGEYTWLFLAIDAFFVWYTIWHWKNR